MMLTPPTPSSPALLAGIEEDRKSIRSWNTFVLAGIAVFMVSLDATVVVAAFPAFQRHFSDASPSSLSWALNGYTIVFASMLVPCGRLANRYGNKQVFVNGIVLFTLASAGCAMAGNAYWLAAARVFQAFGAALLAPSSLSLILLEAPADQRQKAVSLWSAIGALAAAVGPMAGSAIIQWLSWPMIFLINVPVGIMVWWRAKAKLRESMHREVEAGFGSFNTALIILGVGALAYGIVRSGEVGPRSPESWGTGAAGLVLLAVLTWRARGRKQVGLEFRLFDDRNFIWVSIATFVFGAALSMMFLSFYLFTTGVWQYEQNMAGMAATPGPIIVIVVIVLTSNWAMKLGHRPLLVVGSMLYAISNLWFFCTLRIQPDYWRAWLPGQILGGTAIGLVLPTLAGAAVAGLRPGSFAVGNAVNAALRQLGGALGVALCIALAGGPHASIENFRSVYACLAFAGLVIAALCLPIRAKLEGKIAPNNLE